MIRNVYLMINQVLGSERELLGTLEELVGIWVIGLKCPCMGKKV